MTPLRIAMLSPFPPLKGGIARFSSRLVHAFGEAGREVLPAPFRRLWPRWLMKGRPALEPESEPMRATPFSLDLMNPFSWLKVAFGLRASRSDVLLLAYWSALLAPLCAVVRRVSGLKTVVLLHNFTSHESIPGESMLKRLLVASSDGWITLSRSVESELLAFAPGAHTLCLFHPLYERQGPMPSRSEARKRLGLADTSRVVLFFGYVREYKGLDLLLEAMQLVLDREPLMRLVVAGEFMIDASVFRAQAERLGIAGKVDFREGYVPAGEVAVLMAAADAVVLPYRSATQSGVVSLAFGHGVPVIACNAGDLAVQVEHRRTGWIIGEEGASALASGILDFFNERDRLPFEQGIEEFCRTHSWNEFAGRATRFLERCSGRVA
ncbi:MAG: glycosyltransferase [Chlorobiaceae bacterium]|nr:glycosyltransferase [Chlorobiaceae bacterium]